MLKGALVGFGEVARNGHWPAWAAQLRRTDRGRRRSHSRAARAGRQPRAGNRDLRHARRAGVGDDDRLRRYLHPAGASSRADARRDRPRVARALRKALSARPDRSGCRAPARGRAGRGRAAGAQLEIRPDHSARDRGAPRRSHRPAQARGDRNLPDPGSRRRRSGSSQLAPRFGHRRGRHPDGPRVARGVSRASLVRPAGDRRACVAALAG